MSIPSTGLLDPRDLDALFWAWLPTEQAQEIVERMREYNGRLRDRGFPHYGLNALGEVVRWHMHLDKGPEAGTLFKVNSIYFSRLARWLMLWYPEEFPPVCQCKKHRRKPLTYFELRELKSSADFDPSEQGPADVTRKAAPAPQRPTNPSPPPPAKENTSVGLPRAADAPLKCPRCPRTLYDVREGGLWNPDQLEGTCSEHGRLVVRRTTDPPGPSF